MLVKSLKYLVLIITIFCVNFSSAQNSKSAYFLDNLPTRSDYNPSFQPINNSFNSIPLLGTLENYMISDLKSFKQTGFAPNDLIDLKDMNNPFYLQQNSQLNIFNQQKIKLYEFGFRANRAFWTFSMALRSENNFKLPGDALKFYSLLGENVVDNSLDLSSAAFNTKVYSEISLGYSRYISEIFSYGFKLKYLMGNGYFNYRFNQLGLNANANSIRLTANTNLDYAASYFNPDSMSVKDAGFSELIKPQGMGGAVDIGFTYKPFSQLVLSGAVLDLGWLGWNNVKNASYSLNTMIDAANNFSIPDRSGIHLDNLTAGSYSSYLTPKYNVGAEFQLLENFMSLGLLSSGMYYNSKLDQELTASLNLKPFNWLNMAVSYSAFNGKMSNLGAALGLRMKKIHCFVSADYIPLQTVSTTVSGMPYMGEVKMFMPYHSNRMNFSIGFNYVLGMKQDADKDGVSDPNDNCMYTPSGVRVDSHGCPVDTDKDGVPDYLDRCENTPPQAHGFITEYGCPTDKDGDKVPDYMDVCPENPREANATVDENGCPKDSDADGIPDYLDICPETPGSAKVDAKGCPLDTDGDGVYDYLDLCPDTPEAAKGMVDANGCPVDNDDDGVLDYLDLCPGTPFEARGFTDKSGCLLDADDDGVPDYKDKCPNTPYESRELVDENGCPLDSDFDGIPDFKDICPKLPGKESNLGCPDNIVEPSPVKEPEVQKDIQKTEAPVQAPLQNTKI